MKRSAQFALCLVPCALLLAGCSAQDRFVGTWQSVTEAAPEQTFEFGAVTFAPDKTYTAQMVYNGDTVAETGHWSVWFGGLNIGDTRRYLYRFDGNDTVFLRDRESDSEIELSRFK
ncbi:MAG: hypothetical protein ACIAQF_05580 [Phycisphaerales bacterium JB065]